MVNGLITICPFNYGFIVQIIECLKNNIDNSYMVNTNIFSLKND